MIPVRVTSEDERRQATPALEVAEDAGMPPLVAERAGRSFGFKGRLEMCPVAHLAQVLGRNHKSGRLHLATPDGEGSIEIVEGRITGASLGRLEGIEAVLAAIELDRGAFVFLPEQGTAEPADGLDFESLIFESIRLRGELEARRHLLPAQDCRLALVPATNEPGDEPAELPTAALAELLRTAPGTTLSQLLAAQLAAPVKVCLALTRLCEAERIIASPGAGKALAEGPAPLDAALRELLQTAVFRGLDLSSVAVTIQVDPPSLAQLVALLERLPATLLGAGGSAAIGRLRDEGRGELALVHPTGTLVLRCETLVPGGEVAPPSPSLGTVLWLGERLPGWVLPQVLATLDAARRQGNSLLLVAASKKAHDALAVLVGEVAQPQVTAGDLHQPADLLYRLSAVSTAARH